MNLLTQQMKAILLSNSSAPHSSAKTLQLGETTAYSFFPKSVDCFYEIILSFDNVVINHAVEICILLCQFSE